MLKRPAEACRRNHLHVRVHVREKSSSKLINSDHWFMLQAPFHPVTVMDHLLWHSVLVLLFGLAVQRISNMDELSWAEQAVYSSRTLSASSLQLHSLQTPHTNLDRLDFWSFKILWFFFFPSWFQDVDFHWTSEQNIPIFHLFPKGEASLCLFVIEVSDHKFVFDRFFFCTVAWESHICWAVCIINCYLHQSVSLLPYSICILLVTSSYNQQTTFLPVSATIVSVFVQR